MNVDEREQELTRQLLQSIEAEEQVSQRKLASNLGIAVGLTNSYLKRLIKKGFVKMEQVPANRYAYMLTPKGFSEKAQLVAAYMQRSLSLYRDASSAYADCVQQLREQQHSQVILCGASELAEIASLWLMRANLSVSYIFDQDSDKTQYAQYDVKQQVSVEDARSAAFLLTTLHQERLLKQLQLIAGLDMARVVVPTIL